GQRVVVHDSALDGFGRELTGRADLHGHPLAHQIRGLGDAVVVSPHDDDLPGGEVRIREIYGLGPFIGNGHRRDDDVVMAREQTGDDSFPSYVLDDNLHAHAAADFTDDVHVEAVKLARRLID